MYLYLPHFILLLLIHWLIGERSHFSLSNSRDDDEICLAVARSVSVSVQNPTMNFFSYAFTSRWPPSSKYNLDCSITDWTHKSTPSAPQTCKADEDDGYFHRAAHIKCSNSWNCQWHSPPPGFHGQENGIQLYPCDLWLVSGTHNSAENFLRFSIQFSEMEIQSHQSHFRSSITGDRSGIFTWNLAVVCTWIGVFDFTSERYKIQLLKIKNLKTHALRLLCPTILVGQRRVTNPLRHESCLPLRENDRG